MLMDEITKKKIGDEIDFPAEKTTSLFGILKGFDLSKNKTGQPHPNPKGKPIEPIALIIKDNFEVEIRENVPEGVIKINRRLAQDKEETVRIINPKSKLLSFNFGNETIRGWIIDEKEAVALPHDVKHDSWELKRIFDALVMNYKSMDDNSKNKWWFYVIAGIVVIIIASMMFGVDLASVVGMGGTQNITYIVQDANQVVKPVIGLVRAFI